MLSRVTNPPARAGYDYFSLFRSHVLSPFLGGELEGGIQCLGGISPFALGKTPVGLGLLCLAVQKVGVPLHQKSTNNV